VLAATFSALGVLPLVPFAELGFAVAFGVLLDTLIVRSLLVPALVYELDDKVWWPNTIRRTAAAEPTPPRQRSSGEPDRTAIRREG
jgi:RND superfamily putative drug exporter